MSVTSNPAQSVEDELDALLPIQFALPNWNGMVRYQALANDLFSAFGEHSHISTYDGVRQHFRRGDRPAPNSWKYRVTWCDQGWTTIMFLTNSEEIAVYVQCLIGEAP